MLSNGPWPPAVGEHLAIKYRFDQIKIGEFVGFCAGLPTNENLEVRIFKKFSLDVPNNMSLWQDCDDNKYIIDKDSVLPARPLVEVVPSLSRMTRSGRQMVFQVENFELMKALVTIGTETDLFAVPDFRHMLRDSKPHLIPLSVGQSVYHILLY